MDLCKEWFIYGKTEQDKYGEPIVGGIANGFDEQSLIQFWNGVVEGCASYLFNKSHATSYSLISNITVWLKYYYPCEFFTANLSLLDNEDKVDKYISIAEDDYKIKVLPPDVNRSEAYFTCDSESNEILFGLTSIKGIGEAPMEAIINNRPYNSLEDFCTRLTRKQSSKTVCESLIKSGAFDSLYKTTNSDVNRYGLLNDFYILRKVKTDLYNINEYNRDKCILFEKDRLGISLTYKEWIKLFNDNDEINISCIINSIEERNDKKGNLMAFTEIEKDGIIVPMTIFASSYIKNKDILTNSFKSNIPINIKSRVGTFKGKKNLTFIKMN